MRAYSLVCAVCVALMLMSPALADSDSQPVSEACASLQEGMMQSYQWNRGTPQARAQFIEYYILQDLRRLSIQPEPSTPGTQAGVPIQALPKCFGDEVMVISSGKDGALNADINYFVFRGAHSFVLRKVVARAVCRFTSQLILSSDPSRKSDEVSERAISTCIVFVTASYPDPRLFMEMLRELARPGAE